jgi:tRNA U34 5-methylaminomethyl-2-thiouridine-forming methyltransferase MnmC
VPELNECYHSIHGAAQESNFIFIESGYRFCNADPLNILEVGFGTGLNALLSAVESCCGNREVRYTTIEKYPLDEKVISQLNHHQFASDGKKLAELIHSTPWNSFAAICNNFNLRKIHDDLLTVNLSETFDLIYFDAFGPDKQMEMWTVKVFEKIASLTRSDGVLVTYSAKGEVKRNLRACGFKVELLPGPPGKRQIIRAIKF